MDMQSFEFVKVETEDRILKITINRPEVMNALHPPTSHEMATVLDHFDENPDLWVAIITGAGDRAFSAGNDLKWTAMNAGRLDMPRTGFGGITAREGLVKPVIAAVNGVALGGGFEIALACDIILASTNARFGLPEPKVGLAALAGGMHRLPRQIGMKNAMALLLTGRHIDAQEAFRLGVAQDLVEPENLEARAMEWAREICQCAPLSVRATKQAAMEGLEKPLAEAMVANYPAVSKMFRSGDFIEGPRAFAAKRKPEWKGQ